MLSIRSRSGMAIPLVMAFCAIAFAIGFALHALRRNQAFALDTVVGLRRIHSVGVQALEEGHYLFTLGYRPESRWGSKQAKAAKRARGMAGFAAPDADPGLENLDHDACEFLLGSRSTLAFAPGAVRQALGHDGAIDVGPVEVRVQKRDAAPEIALPADAKALPAFLLGDLGLPAGLQKMQRSWGVLEMSCVVTLASGPRSSVKRRVVQRKLFTVLRYTEEGEDKERRYGYVFPQPLAQYFEVS